MYKRQYYYFAYANAEDLKADLAEASDPADPFGTNAGARAISRDENGNPVKVWQINLYAIWDNVEKTQMCIRDRARPEDRLYPDIRPREFL